MDSHVEAGKCKRVRANQLEMCANISYTIVGCRPIIDALDLFMAEFEHLNQNRASKPEEWSFSGDTKKWIEAARYGYGCINFIGYIKRKSNVKMQFPSQKN